MLVYATYKPLWAHKYHSHYQEVCEHFIMPLHTLIFLKECDCLSQEELQVIAEYADYYLTENVLQDVWRFESTFPTTQIRN